jgi:hypothetical protein
VQRRRTKKARCRIGSGALGRRSAGGAAHIQALPELDASANAVAIQSITLRTKAGSATAEVSEPAEPSFTEP